MEKKLITILAIFLLIASISGHTVYAQCTNQIFHPSGTQTINGVQVTVIPFGDCDTNYDYCSGATQPYIIGSVNTYPNHNGGFTFQFSPPISSLSLNFGGIHNFGFNVEIVKIILNENHYAIPAVGTLNGCDSLAILTPLGEITGATDGSASGWSGTTITGQISEISVIDSVVSGGPNGSVFSIFICSEFTTSIAGNNNISFSIYPIPANEKITIEAPEHSSFEIINLFGQTMLKQILHQAKTEIDISLLAKGIYFVKLNNKGTVELRKIVKE